jgi:hypothetical protein
MAGSRDIKLKNDVRHTFCTRYDDKKVWFWRELCLMLPVINYNSNVYGIKLVGNQTSHSLPHNTQSPTIITFSAILLP